MLSPKTLLQTTSDTAVTVAPNTQYTLYTFMESGVQSFLLPPLVAFMFLQQVPLTDIKKLNEHQLECLQSELQLLAKEAGEKDNDPFHPITKRGLEIEIGRRGADDEESGNREQRQMRGSDLITTLLLISSPPPAVPSKSHRRILHAMISPDARLPTTPGPVVPDIAPSGIIHYTPVVLLEEDEPNIFRILPTAARDLLQKEFTITNYIDLRSYEFITLKQC
ncbi:hypothetical protein EX30DRAFT_348356 [Ascodesmis nigricans]|uniref:Uncharacterized protein n=1 Tax=Ascodesmis nigricans TaxID=341454 RepID=A0A4S2MZH3_9PEZI|nr:hypothetical protein EX30DRAFT_348356 [Ascodesmis nigricans]